MSLRPIPRITAVSVSLLRERETAWRMLKVRRFHRERERRLAGSMMRKWRIIVKEALDQTSLVAKFLCLLHVTNNYLCSPTHVFGPSMLPTLNLAGDVIMAEHVSHRLGKVGRGDVVLVRSPLDPKKTVTKRIVGVEGDKVTYVADHRRSDRCQTVVVPKGHVWIQGDNMYWSTDSRHFGPVPYGLIQGKVFLRVWPPESFGSLRE